ncbi:hypothetical protein MLD38_007459 [Melastoma candidum]|uniref:Uncharacterized protein n=1 Tax=Melastoma candidum TaxID=119954 RepID=A0ACB9RQX5_9MYRT|nr:hypothetical protein MLD38_007459 [Melastoma candidum]
MAAQANGTTPQDPVAVGNTFIDQYYNTLQQSPHLVHRFYTDNSELSRPGPDGQMTSVTTMQGINDKILSMGYEKYHLQIVTADSQASYQGGVFVLVTGRLTGEDEKKRTFSQSFFLAPQDNGFFVLNDIFRYLDSDFATPVSAAEDFIDTKAVEAPIPEPETNDVSEPEVARPEGDIEIVVSVEESAVVKEGIPESYSNITQEDTREVVLAPIPDDNQAHAHKKSFASIVSALKQNNAPFQVRAPLVKPPLQPRAVVTPEASSTPNGNIPAEKTEISAAKRYSIFVGNLPQDATPAQLETAFKKFGSIRKNGIQVRSSKGSCYGFVDFESESAMLNALQETSILIGNRTAHIEEQKKDGVDRGRPQGGRGGFRNDQYRNRGSFPGERRTDYSGRGGGGNGGGRWGDDGGRSSFQREYLQNGGRRGPRPMPPAA